MRQILVDRSYSEIIDAIDLIKLDGEEPIKVRACGICQSDISRFFNGTAYYYPIVLGHEFSGTIENSGEPCTVFPLIPCMECEMCKAGNYAQCSDYMYYGSRCDGAMQEKINVKKWNIIPDNRLTYEELATIEPSSVAMNATSKITCDNNQTILLNGCGFIALVAAQILLSKGFKVLMRNRNQAKLEFAENHFDIHRYNNEKVDVAIDFVSNTESMNFLIDKMKPFGQIVCVGNPSKNVDISRDMYSKILRKEISIDGVWNSKREHWSQVMDLISEKKVDVSTLITHKYHFTEYEKAFAAMKSNQESPKEVIIKSMLLF